MLEYFAAAYLVLGILFDYVVFRMLCGAGSYFPGPITIVGWPWFLLMTVIQPHPVRYRLEALWKTLRSK